MMKKLFIFIAVAISYKNKLTNTEYNVKKRETQQLNYTRKPNSSSFILSIYVKKTSATIYIKTIDITKIPSFILHNWEN